MTTQTRRFKVGDKVIIAHDNDDVSWNGHTATVIKIGIRQGSVVWDYQIRDDVADMNIEYDDCELEPAQPAPAAPPSVPSANGDVTIAVSVIDLLIADTDKAINEALVGSLHYNHLINARMAYVQTKTALQSKPQPSEPRGDDAPFVVRSGDSIKVGDVLRWTKERDRTVTKIVDMPGHGYRKVWLDNLGTEEFDEQFYEFFDGDAYDVRLPKDTTAAPATDTDTGAAERATGVAPDYPPDWNGSNVTSDVYVGTLELPAVKSMYGEISGILDTPGAYHKCKVCGNEMSHNPGDGGRYTRHGWPKCCGYTMTFVQPSLAKKPVPADVQQSPTLGTAPATAVKLGRAAQSVCWRMVVNPNNRLRETVYGNWYCGGTKLSTKNANDLIEAGMIKQIEGKRLLWELTEAGRDLGRSTLAR